MVQFGYQTDRKKCMWAHHASCAGGLRKHLMIFLLHVIQRNLVSFSFQTWLQQYVIIYTKFNWQRIIAITNVWDIIDWYDIPGNFCSVYLWVHMQDSCINKIHKCNMNILITQIAKQKQWCEADSLSHVAGLFTINLRKLYENLCFHRMHSF